MLNNTCLLILFVPGSSIIGYGILFYKVQVKKITPENWIIALQFGLISTTISYVCHQMFRQLLYIFNSTPVFRFIHVDVCFVPRVNNKDDCNAFLEYYMIVHPEE